MKRGFALLALAWALLAPLAAQAIPAFSRQIHAGCDACHFQSMGALNRFGRAFEMNNFRLTPKMRRQLREWEKKQKQRRKTETEKKAP